MTDNFLCVPLYDGVVPFSHIGGNEPMPFAEIYVAEPDRNTGRVIVAFAGGAYRFLSKLSGSDYGRYFSERGINVVSVNFRLGSAGYDGRAFCADALAAVALVEKNAAQWGIDIEKIGLIGTSAGGHLVGMISTGLAERLLRKTLPCEFVEALPLSWRPECAIFCYSVMSLQQPLWHVETAKYFLGDVLLDPHAQYWASPCEHITSEHCRAFLWHTAEDTEVSLANTLVSYEALTALGVCAELHVYNKGPHALGLATELKHGLHLNWADDAIRWILNQPVEALTITPNC